MAEKRKLKEVLTGGIPAAEKKQKMIVAAVSLCLMIIFRILEPAAETMDVIGMILAVIAVALVLFRFSMTIYLPALIFVVLAGAGSIYLMYDKLPGWDRFVHYFSGVVLGAIGYTAMEKLMKWRNLPEDPVILLLTGFMFTGMCAGAWEIGEFSADQFLGMGVQHGNTDTMGDIVCGFLGGLTFCIAKILFLRAEKKKKQD